MKIIINADDFGISNTVNEVIINCHKNGVLTSTTLLAGGSGFNDAVVKSNKYPKLGIGVHLAIDGPFNILKKSSLVDPKSGKFYNSNEIIKRIYFMKIKHQDLIEEYSAQIEKILNADIKISHIDHHHHFHLHLPILKAVIEVAKKYKIDKIRTQKILLNENTSYIKKIYRTTHSLLVNINNLKSPDGYFIFNTKDEEKLSQKIYKILEMKTQLIELVVHPQTSESFEYLILTSDYFNKFKNIEYLNYNNI